MPENTVYGLKLKGLQDTIRKWAFAHQKELFKIRPKLKDYELMGGSYQDNTGSVLFNKFFNDNQDKGEADYGGEDEDFESMLDTYDRESREIIDQYNSESEIATITSKLIMTVIHMSIIQPIYFLNSQTKSYLKNSITKMKKYLKNGSTIMTYTQSIK
jgi:hypothetical protein